MAEVLAHGPAEVGLVGEVQVGGEAGGFAVLGVNLRFAALMATGSIVGALLGGLLLSAAKVARHD